MKLIHCLLFFALPFSIHSYEEILLAENMPVTHHIEHDSEACIQVEDLSCWHCCKLTPKRQSIYEWFYDIKTDQEYPEAFYFSGNFCQEGDLISIYITEPAPLICCPYVLKNQKTGSKIFGHLQLDSHHFHLTPNVVAHIKQFPICENDPLNTTYPYIATGCFIQDDHTIWRINRMWTKELAPTTRHVHAALMKAWKKGDPLNFYEYSFELDGIAHKYHAGKTDTLYLVENQSTGHYAFLESIELDEFTNLLQDQIDKLKNKGDKLQKENQLQHFLKQLRQPL